jgi:hypothetical protein
MDRTFFQQVHFVAVNVSDPTYIGTPSHLPRWGEGRQKVTPVGAEVTGVGFSLTAVGQKLTQVGSELRRVSFLVTSAGGRLSCVGFLVTRVGVEHTWVR